MQNNQKPHNQKKQKQKKKTSWLYDLDIFGLTYNFNLEGNELIKSNLGLIFSCCYMIIVIALFFGFGVDLYQRKMPMVSFNNKLSAYEEAKLSNSNFTLAFRLEDTNGLWLRNDSIAYLELLYYKFVLNAQGEWEEVLNGLRPYKKCAEINSINEISRRFNLSLESWFCLDFDELDTLGGFWDGTFLYGLKINARQCSNAKNLTCLEDAKLKSEFQTEMSSGNFFYSFMHMEVLPVLDDYEDPIKVHLKNKYEILSLKATKRLIHTFKTVSTVTDKGWIFPEYQTTTLLSTDSILQDFAFKDEFSQDLIFTHTIYFGNKLELYNRSYVKVQQVIAAIGGFAKVCHFVLNFLYLYFAKYLKDIYLMGKFEVEIEEWKGNNCVVKSSQFVDDIYFKSTNLNNNNNFNLEKNEIIYKNDIDKNYNKNYKQKKFSANSKFTSSNKLNSAINENNSLNRNIFTKSKQNKNKLKNNINNIKTNININNNDKNNIIQLAANDNSSNNLCNLNNNYNTHYHNNNSNLEDEISIPDLNKISVASKKLKQLEKNLNTPSEININNHNNNKLNLNNSNNFNHQNERSSGHNLNSSKVLVKSNKKISLLKLICCRKKAKNGKTLKIDNFYYKNYEYFHEKISKRLEIISFFNMCSEFEEIKNLFIDSENYKDLVKSFSNKKICNVESVLIDEQGIIIENSSS